jgi:hypothetical protein
VCCPGVETSRQVSESYGSDVMYCRTGRSSSSLGLLLGRHGANTEATGGPVTPAALRRFVGFLAENAAVARGSAAMAGVPAHATPTSPEKSCVARRSFPADRRLWSLLSPPLAVSTSCVFRAHLVAALLPAVEVQFAPDFLVGMIGPEHARLRRCMCFSCLFIGAKFHADSAITNQHLVFR